MEESSQPLPLLLPLFLSWTSTISSQSNSFQARRTEMPAATQLRRWNCWNFRVLCNASTDTQCFLLPLFKYLEREGRETGSKYLFNPHLIQVHHSLPCRKKWGAFIRVKYTTFSHFTKIWPNYTNSRGHPAREKLPFFSTTYIEPFSTLFHSQSNSNLVQIRPLKSFSNLLNPNSVRYQLISYSFTQTTTFSKPFCFMLSVFCAIFAVLYATFETNSWQTL